VKRNDRVWMTNNDFTDVGTDIFNVLVGTAVFLKRCSDDVMFDECGKTKNATRLTTLT
jgi:hypothetical protein